MWFENSAKYTLAFCPEYKKNIMIMCELYASDLLPGVYLDVPLPLTETSKMYSSMSLLV